MNRFLAAASFLAWGLVPPAPAAAAALPEGGGDPGKAYRACLDAIAKPDKAAVVALCFSKDDAWLAKTNVGYFQDDAFALEVKDQHPGLRLIEVKIAGGKVEGGSAELFVAGTVVRHRLEPTGDIVEIDRYPVKGTVTLRGGAGAWRYAGEKIERVN